MTQSNTFSIRKRFKQATHQLASLNREMALQMINLASQTGDIEPLIEAVKALRSTEELYTQTNTPIDNAQIQKKLGDVLLSVGKSGDDARALKYAVIAYRGAITIASLLGAENLRRTARQNYALAMKLSGYDDGKSSYSLMGAA